jgi:hypothetical protein
MTAPTPHRLGDRVARLTQEDTVLALLRERRSLGVTPLLALDRCQCFRLAAVVFRLKELGHDIETQMVTLDNGKRVACYVLHERPAQLGLSL